MFPTVHRFAVAGGVVIALTAGSGGAIASQARQNTEVKGEGRFVSAQTMRANESLDGIAELLGRAVGDKALRQQIRDQILERGTPDKAVTFRSLSDSSDIRRQLAQAYRDERSTSETEALNAVDELTASLPPTQVSVPIKMGAWNAATVAPLVGYVPAGIDDTDLKTITAYDSAGRARVLDAWVEPDQPVIILGPDETMLHDGSVSTANKAVGSSRQASSAALASCYDARLTYVRLWNDREPWVKGMAEIFLAAKGPGLWFMDEFPYLEQDGDQIWPDTFLGCTEGDVRFYWWEDDSASYDFTLAYGGVSFGVAMSDDDDLIGGRQLDWATFAGTTERTTNFTDLVMKTQ